MLTQRPNYSLTNMYVKNLYLNKNNFVTVLQSDSNCTNHMLLVTKKLNGYFASLKHRISCIFHSK